MLRQLLLAVAMLLVASVGLAAVNINTATKEELDALPGIGPVKAQAIIDYRSANGPFKTPEDVMKVKGIKEGEFGKIKDQITVRGATSTSTKAAAPAAAAPAAAAPAATAQAPAPKAEAPKAAAPAKDAAPPPAPKDDKAAKAKEKEDKAAKADKEAKAREKDAKATDTKVKQPEAAKK
jgi:competence protein ComEA